MADFSCSGSATTKNRSYRRNLDQNYLSGPIPSFIGQLTALTELHVGFNPLSGSLPKELGNLTNLNLLGISLTNFSGQLPEELGNLTKLRQLYTDSAGLSGPFPSTLSRLKNLKLLRASDNNFTGTIPDFIGSLSNLEDLAFQDYSFAVDCGSNRSIRVSDNTMYELDSTNLGDSSYYVTSQTRWGVSNVGKLFQAPNDSKIIHSGEKIQNAVDSELFQTAEDVAVVSKILWLD
ncbi:hypothetical protein OsI_28199 [Oryza sativa Indica Group]|uniref:non-specific serine/threonine protein kinase n=1 Tax=Oryza sativa subsp. indica TaxID=39946 RepID=B8BBQ0_ORYSI|nr:hypothetical protein OsI_28199 [Oryza sativa Indica Group]